MKTVSNCKKCLGYFESANQEEIFEINNFNITNSELILEAMAK
ncbi:hypothetical protein SAMN04488007_1269 [Maribacter aquivivus]|uniref:Uncharacterized protein n=1 Tax=Maribacter aquivivus TaxID=228958 RepID=A0A1M6LRQ7_9FLAO|nr:hypothetical protein [Maribacter aquivivus]SHJ73889.1 hypothetical protein SAMN04488007_1269 [Maribacter aquivivus]